MKESDITTPILKCLRHRFGATCAIEIKICKTGSLPFSRLEEHQKNALLNTKHGCVVHKIADCGYQNPFDAVILCEEPAFVVVMFYRRGQKEFFAVDIDEWCLEEKNSTRKSLTESRAREIGVSFELA